MPGISQSIANLIPFHIFPHEIFHDFWTVPVNMIRIHSYSHFLVKIYACGLWVKKNLPPLPSAKSWDLWMFIPLKTRNGNLTLWKVDHSH